MPPSSDPSRSSTPVLLSAPGQGAELTQQLQKLQGPVLGPADITQPLPLL